MNDQKQSTNQIIYTYNNELKEQLKKACNSGNPKEVTDFLNSLIASDWCKRSFSTEEVSLLVKDTLIAGDTTKIPLIQKIIDEKNGKDIFEIAAKNIIETNIRSNTAGNTVFLVGSREMAGYMSALTGISADNILGNKLLNMAENRLGNSSNKKYNHSMSQQAKLIKTLSNEDLKIHLLIGGIIKNLLTSYDCKVLEDGINTALKTYNNDKEGFDTKISNWERIIKLSGVQKPELKDKINPAFSLTQAMNSFFKKLENAKSMPLQ